MKDGAIEVGMFKLKNGIELQDATLAYQNMIKHFLSKQTGWEAQSLIFLENGTLIDLAWAETIDVSKLICSLWGSSKECLEFLALIEPISMEFGRVISLDTSGSFKQ
ncbi:hypothetical protein [Acinetobacter sp. ANC 4177]|uniref:hypothetical protein n=1 Tax=Acinetobacter sp. ANC 4177 TaxID=2529838 RepID=UPI00103B1FB1|nr:hypothetical protein [Acinetobacter sp. ANC 4177]TCB76802.1 hypothetical protein E0H91_00635 [Acinetobacter sp. ANC 4177]